MDGDRERLIVGCVTGEVLVVEALDLKVVLHTEGAAAADCIVPYSKGFLVGQSNGAVAVFERDDRDSYLRSKVCQLFMRHASDNFLPASWHIQLHYTS